ncbi:unnamed protein product, partial [Staurois parvus]
MALIGCTDWRHRWAQIGRTAGHRLAALLGTDGQQCWALMDTFGAVLIIRALIISALIISVNASFDSCRLS